ncbi:hypothetical protein BDW22DRAFT_279415 [Trametopsis cervina]|nr:hypothetical protein BDW22DRAFT_279415 [Trametopsis cervina]
MTNARHHRGSVLHIASLTPTHRIRNLSYINSPSPSARRRPPTHGAHSCCNYHCVSLTDRASRRKCCLFKLPQAQPLATHYHTPRSKSPPSPCFVFRATNCSHQAHTTTASVSTAGRPDGWMIYSPPTYHIISRIQLQLQFQVYVALFPISNPTTLTLPPAFAKTEGGPFLHTTTTAPHASSLSIQFIRQFIHSVDFHPRITNFVEFHRLCPYLISSHLQSHNVTIHNGLVLSSLRSSAPVLNSLSRIVPSHARPLNVPSHLHSFARTAYLTHHRSRAYPSVNRENYLYH